MFKVRSINYNIDSIHTYFRPPYKFKNQKLNQHNKLTENEVIDYRALMLH